MKHNCGRPVLRWLSFLALTGLSMLIRVPAARAVSAIPVAVVTCSTCESASDLMASALNYWANYDNATPSGYVGTLQDWGNCSNNPTSGPSMVLVVSTAIAISGGFYGCWIYPKGGPVMRTYMIDGTSNANAVTDDNIIFARAAAEAGRVALPSTLPLNNAGGNSTPELQGAYLNSVLIESGMPETNLWHGIIDYPNVLEGTFTNTQTGKQFTIWSGDTITVTDQNGWTAKFQWNPLADPQWQYVPNSIRDQHGNPVNTTGSNPPHSGGSPQPGGRYNVTLPPDWGALPIYLEPIYDDPAPGGTITVGPIGPTTPYSYQCAAIGAGNDCAP